MTPEVMGRAPGACDDRAMALLERGLDAMAWGRIALGIGSLASPSAMSRAFGNPHSPEVAYLTRIYGARAVALGAAYLMAGPAERDRLQLLSLGVDVSDTLTGAGHLVRGDSTRRAMAMVTALTGTYAAIGAARAARRHASA